MGMYRKDHPIGPRLEALLDERDHLRVKISLAEEQGEDALQLRSQLRELEREIDARWARNPEL